MVHITTKNKGLIKRIYKLDYDTFTQLSYDFWKRYLQRVSALQQRGSIIQVKDGVKSPNTLILLYPTILVCTQTNEYFISELMGSQQDFNDLKLKRNKVSSINHYFYQFNIDATDPALLIDNKYDLKFHNMLFSHPVDLDSLYQRFPYLAISDEPKIVAGSGYGAVIEIRNRSNFISFQNCTLVNRYSSALRMKHLLQAVVIHRETNSKQYLDFLKQFQETEHIYGIQYINFRDEEPYKVASQFASIFLFPNLHETTIGEFLKSHPEIIKIALNTPRFEYEPYFEWQEGNPNPEEQAINPDLLIQRLDGYFDIYDLKRALLDRTKLTKGRRRRRRFVDYIAEGAAQLAHYDNYFRFPKNQEYAFEKYQVRVSDPHLVLVVGNFENINITEIDEACRMLKNFEIIDYDTILHLYLKLAIPTYTRTYGDLSKYV